jgi:hypothetical protein
MPKIPEGTIFILTEGDYEEYGIYGLYRTTSELDTVELMNKYLAYVEKQKPIQEKGEGEYREIRVKGFWEWLKNTLLFVEPVEHIELFLEYSIGGPELIKG